MIYKISKRIQNTTSEHYVYIKNQEDETNEKMYLYIYSTRRNLRSYWKEENGTMKSIN